MVGNFINLKQSFLLRAPSIGKCEHYTIHTFISSIAGSAQDNIMPSVLEELLDLFAKDVKDVLKKNV